jgi:tRNA(fMet)-specific endonuclease VapC
MYLLDTNILIYAKNERNIHVRNRIKLYDNELLFTSVFTVAEMVFGCSKSENPIRNKQALLEFLLPFNVLTFEQIDCDSYGEIRSFLEKKGEPIGTIDTFIGAMAVSRNLTLVTNNVREFKKIPGIRIENWAEE